MLLISQVDMSFAQRFGKADFKRMNAFAGNWETKRTEGTIYEQWRTGSQDELIGKSFKVSGRDTVQLETMRLYRAGNEIIFAPVTAGQNDEKAVLFKLKSIERNQFIFENPSHDFPQRIVYELKSPDVLNAYIEGKINAETKRIDFPYTRIKKTD
jgi:hypothetical protein